MTVNKTAGVRAELKMFLPSLCFLKFSYCSSISASSCSRYCLLNSGPPILRVDLKTSMEFCLHRRWSSSRRSGCRYGLSPPHTYIKKKKSFNHSTSKMIINKMKLFSASIFTKNVHILKILFVCFD